MSEYPWNETDFTFTWLNYLYNPFKILSNLSVNNWAPIHTQRWENTSGFDTDNGKVWIIKKHPQMIFTDIYLIYLPDIYNLNKNSEYC